mgnify:FL=1
MNKILVFQSDFGLVDGAVSAMEGVALQVDPELKLHNLTHDITPYNIFEGSYRLFQTVNYWPQGTVFVSVVDPGVGTSRKSVVAKTATGQYIVTPDNGTLTHLNKYCGIVALREIEESVNRRKNTELSYTFHGRDVYAYTGARLASGVISYEEVGKELPLSEIVELDVVETEYNKEEKSVTGCVDILDVRFGSLWTSISRDDFYLLNPEFGKRYEVSIYHEHMLVYQNQVVYQHSFAEVAIGSPLLYINSVYRLGIAINQGSFARAYNVGTGTNWKIRIRAID